MRFVLTVAGEVQMDREIEAIGTHAEGIDQVLRDIARDLNKETKEQFETEGRHASGGWPPLTDRYAKRKARMIATGKFIAGRRARYMQILRLTDRLRLSLVNRDDPEHVETIEDHTLEWGTRVPYARYHQNPGVGPHAQKRRRFLDLPEKKRQDYARAILTYVRTGKSGL
jgi:phage gpG-like protein